MTGRIGVFGGTFDPPHIAHVVAALEARWALSLDVVLLVVANDPWQKTAQAPITEASHRLAMTRAAVEGIAGLEVSDIEIRRGGRSYTADTLADLQRAQPAASFWLILGYDAAAELDTWERAEEVRERGNIVIVNRPSEVKRPLPSGWAFEHVTIPEINLSSTEVRERVASGRPIRYLVPPRVEAYLAQTGLYRGGLADDRTPTTGINRADGR